MKLKTKILFIFIFFSVFFVFSNNNSFALTYNGFELPDFPEDYDDYEYHYIRYNFNAGCFDLVLTNNNIVTSYPACSSCYNQGYKEPYGCTHLVGVHGYRYKPGEKNYWYFHKDFSNLAWVYYDDDQPYIYADTDVYESDGTLYFKANSIENYYNFVIENFLSDKINLFELNLTDSDNNNQKHTFNLATFSGFSCYDELMSYYNNNNRYAIYLTDYNADMVYTDSNYTNLSHGCYSISGYIDFLITDSSFFYYSEYYNKVLSNSGTKIFNKDISKYTKRFYFDLVYSEDTNEGYTNISIHNGNLVLSDDFKEYSRCYFIGSSQTIYYANEKLNHNIKNLSNSIYYLGYIDNENGKIRDISKIPFYVYNFRLGGNYFERTSGGIGDRHISGGWDADGRSGNSYIKGDDETTSTYEKDTVTPDTTTNIIINYIGNDRTPQQEINDDNTSSDTSNWGILDFIKGIFDSISSFVSNLLDGFTGLFVPDDEFFSNTFSGLDEWFTGRLGFLFYPFDLTIDIFNRIINVDFGEPKFEIPDIIEPTTGKTLIAAREFNFNDILQNETFANLYNIYLILVDGIIVFALINLIKNKFGEVMSR